MKPLTHTAESILDDPIIQRQDNPDRIIGILAERLAMERNVHETVLDELRRENFYMARAVAEVEAKRIAPPVRDREIMQAGSHWMGTVTGRQG